MDYCHGWIVASGTVGFGEFCSSNSEGSIFFSFSKFVSLDSFLRLGLVLLGLVLGSRIMVRFRFKPSLTDRS